MEVRQKPSATCNRPLGKSQKRRQKTYIDRHTRKKETTDEDFKRSFRAQTLLCLKFLGALGVRTISTKNTSFTFIKELNSQVHYINDAPLIKPMVATPHNESQWTRLSRQYENMGEFYKTKRSLMSAKRTNGKISMIDGDTFEEICTQLLPACPSASCTQCQTTPCTCAQSPATRPGVMSEGENVKKSPQLLDSVSTATPRTQSADGSECPGRLDCAGRFDCPKRSECAGRFVAESKNDDILMEPEDLVPTCSDWRRQVRETARKESGYACVEKKASSSVMDNHEVQMLRSKLSSLFMSAKDPVKAYRVAKAAANLVLQRKVKAAEFLHAVFIAGNADDVPRPPAKYRLTLTHDHSDVPTARTST